MAALLVSFFSFTDSVKLNRVIAYKIFQIDN